MAIVTTDNANYAAIADAIRAKTGGASTYTPAEMAAAISGIETGGGSGGVSLDNVAILIADYSDSATYAITEGAYYGTKQAIVTI